MFIAALFTIDKIWKSPKCPSTDEERKNMWQGVCVYIYIYKNAKISFFMVNMFFIERRHRRHKNAPKQKLHAESQTHLSLVPFSPVTTQVLNVWLLCFSETTTALGHHFLPYFHVPWFEMRNALGRKTVKYETLSMHEATLRSWPSSSGCSNPTAGHIAPKGKNSNKKGTYTPMFIAALLTIVKKWKQPKSPSTDDWLKKCHTHTHTHTQWITTQPKKNEILLFPATWMDLDNNMLREICQTEKDKYCISSLICGI